MSASWQLCPDGLANFTFLGHQVWAQSLVRPMLELVEVRAWRSEYGRELMQGRGSIGSYNCRNRRPYPETPVTWERHSEHAHGNGTVDVNSAGNPLRSDGVLVTDMDRHGYEDGLAWLAAWLEPPAGLRVLYRWGGVWTTDVATAGIALRHKGERVRVGVVDPMHFEPSLTASEVRAFDWLSAIRKEEAMNRELEAAAEFVKVLREQLKPGREEATAKGAAGRVADAVKKVEAEAKAP